MLTLLETIDAIKALDTPKDILDQALKTVLLGPDPHPILLKPLESLDINGVIRHMMETYFRSLSAHTLIGASLAVSARMSAVSCKPNRLSAIENEIISAWKSEFKVALLLRSVRRGVGLTPEDVGQQILTMLMKDE
jgi:hypothetical protein